MKRTSVFLAMLAMVLLGCPKADDNEAKGDVAILGDAAAQVTYTSAVKALLDANCTRCHDSAKTGADRHDAPVDVNLDTYANLMKHRANPESPDEIVAVEANDEIQSGGMPVDDDGNDTEGLSAVDRATYQAWMDGGMRE